MKLSKLIDLIQYGKLSIPTRKFNIDTLDLSKINEDAYNIITYTIFDTEGNEYASIIDFKNNKKSNTTLAEIGVDLLQDNVGYNINNEIDMKNATKCQMAVIRLTYSDYKKFMVSKLGKDFVPYQLLAYEALTYGAIEYKYISKLKTVEDIGNLKVILNENYNEFEKKLNIKFKDTIR